MRGEEGFCGFCIYNAAGVKSQCCNEDLAVLLQPVHSSQLFSFVSSRQAKIEQYTLPLEGGGRVVGGWWEGGGRVVGGWWEGGPHQLITLCASCDLCYCVSNGSH